MIMMRSTPSAKMGRPPPPVPPRPSKSLVAEALAKTRGLSPKTAPHRIAPDVPKSKSSVCVNVVLKKPERYERSISEEVKCSSRPVVYQSSNVGCNKVTVTRKESLKNDKRDFKSKSESCEELTNIKSEYHDVNKISVNGNNSDSLDRTNWDKMLNDKNHVNTLIDEMFASVLESSANKTDDSKQVEIETPNSDTSDNIPLSSDTNPVTIIKDNDESTNQKDIDDHVSTTVIVINDSNMDQSETKSDSSKSNSSTAERKKVKFDDQVNHELLISELQDMKRDQEKILKRQRKPSLQIFEENNEKSDPPKIQHSDWMVMSDGHEVRLSSCQITIDENENKENKNLALNCERIGKMSSLRGLPPLPKSLSGFNLLDNQSNPRTPVRTSSIRGGQTQPASHLVFPPHQKTVNGAPTDAIPQQGTGRKSTNLDAQLAILKREMYSLRQLDLSLLSQLWSLNESIQDFRQILQDQEDRVLSPPSPSPTPSSGDDGDGDDFYMSTTSMNLRPAPPPPRRASNSSNTSSVG